MAEYENAGIHFKYPENWQVEREETDDGWTVSVQSPETAFLLLCLREDSPSIDSVAESALEALREEYPELEAEACIDSVAGQPAVGHDIRFFSLDLTNTCWTRCFYASHGTILLMGQFNDMESELHGPVLRAICASLKIEDE